MKTRNLLFGAMGLLLMASCAKDEVVSVNHDGDEIAFNVVTNANTRANIESGGVYCNNNLPSAFHVWATTADDNATFIEGDKVVYDGSNMLSQGNEGEQGELGEHTRMVVQHNITGLWTNTCLRYWPEDRNVNFYAAVNALSAGKEGADPNYVFHWNNAGTFSVPTIDVNVPEDVTAQKDLIYAVKTAQNKNNTNGTVNLNFRHALSQVVFTAINPSQKLYAEIKGISICNVKQKGTFTYPANNTDNNINGHEKVNPDENEDVDSGIRTLVDSNTENEGPDYEDGSWGTWGETVNTPVSYSLTFDEPIIFEPAEPDKAATAVQLSGPYSYTDEKSGQEHGTEYNINAMLLVPQTSTAWDPKAEPYVSPINQTEQTYILVDCAIVNIAGETLNKETDLCVWGEKKETTTDNGDGTTTTTITYQTKKVAIPVKLEWQQGKKYIYHFVFGVSGGYDPDPDEPEPKPDPDLVPIDFEITVDEFKTVYEEANETPQGVLQILQ